MNTKDKIICPYCGYKDTDYLDAMEVLRGEGDTIGSTNTLTIKLGG